MTPLPEGFDARPFAHRGLHGGGRPENSLSAVRAAVEAGYGIEIDLQLSADGRAVMFHDHTLDRMTPETGPVRSRTAAELGRIALAGTADRIPTLAEVLGTVAGRVPLLIEIKDQDGALGPAVGALEAAVADDLRDYSGPVAVMGFNPHSVMEMARLAPDLPRGLTTDAFDADEWPGVPADRLAGLRAMARLDAAGAAFVSHDHRDLENQAVAAARASGRRIFCWTIRSQADADRALRIAHAITFEGFRPA